MSEWIKTSDRLPRDCEKVLLCTKDKAVSSGYMIIDGDGVVGVNYSGTTANIKTWGIRGIDFTHWMPLPEPPQD